MTHEGVVAKRPETRKHLQKERDLRESILNQSILNHKLRRFQDHRTPKAEQRPDLQVQGT